MPGGAFVSSGRLQCEGCELPALAHTPTLPRHLSLLLRLNLFGAQENMKKVTWARPPRLSMLQQQAAPYKAAQFAGAALGVALGCLVGMTPLAFMDVGFFVGASEAAGAAVDLASSAAAAGGGAAAEQAAAAAATAAAGGAS